MQYLGTSWPHVLAQGAALAVSVLWLVVTTLALRRLFAYRFTPLKTIVLAILIVIVPFAVALAFLRAHPLTNLRDTSAQFEG
jgi:hypothetical protein